MSIYKSSSLAMIPTAYKDGKLYSIRPTDGSGDFTFSRGSNLAATRVDVNGLIEKGRENLLTESNNFSDSDWVKADTSVTSGQADKDGGTSAWLLSITGAGGYQTLRQTKSVSGVNTISIYAKANALNWMRIINGVSSTYFDISNGVVGADSSIGASIESAGNGFFRCSVPFSGAGSYVYIYPATANNNPNQSSGNILIQDAQLEAGLVATDYIETGTSAAQSGILEDMPRLDYSGSCPSLLLEPQRSNLFNYSEYFGITSWIKSNSSVTTNTAVSPSGNTDANLITSSGSEGQIYQTKTLNGSHTFSAFFKAGTSVLARLQFYDSGAGTSGIGIYNLTTLSVSATGLSSTGTITDYGNGWYRCTLTASLSGSAVLCFLGLNENAKNILAWGAQVEAGSYPTSYIPTYGTSQTRSQDVCADAGDADTFNDSQGVLFAEFSTLIGAGGGTRRIQIQNSGSTQYVRLQVANGDGTLYAIVNNGSQQYLYNYTSFSPTSVNRVALRYEPNNYALYVNGVKVNSQSSGSTFADGVLTETNFSPPSPFYGNIKQTLVFPTALTDSECIALTTL